MSLGLHQFRGGSQKMYIVLKPLYYLEASGLLKRTVVAQRTVSKGYTWNHCHYVAEPT